MQLIISKHANVNYLAKIVKIDTFRKHSDPKIERLKCCSIDGFNVITSIDSEPGLYVYFPVMCKINGDFLAYASLYRNVDKNSNPDKKGMFEDSGRVKAINLHGEKSEGFILPVDEFKNWLVSVTNNDIDILEGTEFDSCEHKGKNFWIVKKYVVREVVYSKSYNHRNKKVKKYDLIIPEQFRFHYETTLIKKCPYVIHPNYTINISEKVHGTSAISAYVLCKKPVNIFKRIWSKLSGKQYTVYDYINASRTRILTEKYGGVPSTGYYDSTTHWRKAHEVVQSVLELGMTVYYEILGYTATGAYIQKGYDYGYVQPTNDKYVYGVHFGIRVYRITITRPSGEVIEWPMTRVVEWCERVGLPHVNIYYTGTGVSLYPDIEQDENWSISFIEHLANDKNFYMEMPSPTCANNVPHEGIVIRIEERDGAVNTKSEAFKLKCFKFLGKEQELIDKGVSNMEDES